MDATHTKTAIIKAAIFMFAKHGKKQATMAEIANRAKVSKTLLFHHFQSKQNLFEKTRQWVIDQFDKLRVVATQQKHPFAAMESVQLAKMDLEKQCPGIFKFYMLLNPLTLKVPKMPANFADHPSMKATINPTQLWHVFYYLSLGYQQAFEHSDDLNFLFQDFQKSYALIKHLVMEKEGQ